MNKKILQRIFFIIFTLKFINSIEIGQIKHASIITNTSFISTLNSKCSDCLCNCLTDSNCYGINCFPSNNSCQYIQQEWIQETSLSYNLISDQFINTIDLNLCSCYSSQNILNNYASITPISTSHPMTRYITYNSYDDTLLVLGDNLIGQYFVSNLTQVRNLSVPYIPLAALIDTTRIYISFYDNASINQYDMQMHYIQSIKRPIYPSTNGQLFDLGRWKNVLLISDKQYNLIWSINLTTMNMSIYLNLTIYNISPFSIAVFNNCLYISQLYLSTIYIFDLINLNIRNITFPNSIQLYRLQKDSFCNRLWFGVKSNNYSSVPVFNLNTNTAQIYQSKGILSTSMVYIVTFDSNYSMYTTAINTNGFSKYQMSTITC